jgi:hypothetical protein
MSQCLSLLSPTGFQLAIEKIPGTVFTAQELSLPGINFGVATQGTPMHQIPVPGDELTYSPFTMSFLVNENMSNYKQIFNWLYALGHPETLDNYAIFHEQESLRLLGKYQPQNHSTLYSDGTLEILSNNNTENNNKIYFVDMFPISLSGLPFSTTVTDMQYLTCTATFMYSHFKF